ncbi:MAG: AAA family ATPase [Treponemataceae bacterium]|nr:AAA family ATPase [Treponemataceae bacterium]HOJ98871.1 AAA family ATPase [Termitinemataceae bacterium]HOM22582.1 AAA family ATPase [Termitinemataceae bacterium]HPQ00062.1 AAA family ATPase [Termitinemataceae bacterium]
MKAVQDLRIAISGKSGCGNTTVSRLLASRLGLRCINFTFRNLAQEQGLSLEEVLRRASTDDWWDREVDRRQVELARQDGGCVLGSRLAIWMLPEADLKVYLRAQPEVRAQRIQQREGGDLETITRFTLERDRQDRERYLRLYGIDNDVYDFADLIIDVDQPGPEEIVEQIVKSLSQRGYGPLPAQSP